jgi:hypothetical protein
MLGIHKFKQRFATASLDPANATLTQEQRSKLLTNIQLTQDDIVLLTANSNPLTLRPTLCTR